MENGMKLITELSRKVQISSNDNGNLYIEGIFSSAEIKNNNGRRYKKDILDREISKINEKIINKSLWGELGHPECVTGDTEILTKNGWKEIKDIDDNEIVATLNVNTQQIEYHQIKNKIIKSYVGNMIRLKGRQIDMMFTPKHRHLLFSRYGTPYFATSTELLNQETLKYKKSYIPKTGNWYSNNENDFYVLKGIDIGSLSYYRNKDIYSNDSKIDMKVFSGFLGIYLSEGCLSKGRNEKNTVNIFQNVGEKADKIRELLNLFPVEMKWNEKQYDNKIIFSITDVRLARLLQPLGDCYTKYIPEEFKNLNIDCLEEIIYWFGLGDGRGFLNDDNKKDIFSTSEKLIDDLHEIAFKCGISAKKTVNICDIDYSFADRVIKSENKQPLYFLKLLTTKGIYPDTRFMSITEEYFEGDVYCVQVENENFYVRNNNSVSFFTGNCPDVNLDKIAIMIESLDWDGDNIIGKAKVLDTPMGNIAKVLIKEGNLGISSRGLGTVNELDGYVNEDYCLITWDLVGEPSNNPSWVKGIYEGKDFKAPKVVTEPIITLENAKNEYYKRIWQVLNNIEKTL